MNTKQPFRLVPDTLSDDTVECLEQLLDYAKSGQIYGIVFAAMLKGRRIITNSAGECSRNPRYARGMVGDLDDFLRSRLKS